MSRWKFRFLSCGHSRQGAFLGLFATLLAAAMPQETQPSEDRRIKPPDLNDDPKLPDGRSQKNAIAKEEHERALRDANELVSAAQDLRDELLSAGDDAVPTDSLKKIEEIEKLARHIRGKLRF